MRKWMLFCLSVLVCTGLCTCVLADWNETCDNGEWVFIWNRGGTEAAILTEYKGNFSHVIVPLAVSYGDERIVVEGISHSCFAGQGIEEVGFELQQDNTTTCTFINGEAFRGCTSLEKVIIPNGVTLVGGFQGCTSLRTVTLAETVNTIDDHAFYGCTSLQSINLEHVVSIGYSAFRETGFETFEWPAHITDLHSSTFQGCASLTRVVLPDTLKELEDNTFQDCTALTDITLPSGITGLPSQIFAGCTSLRSIDIPDGVTSLAYRAFDGCSALTEVQLPAGLKSIGDSCFSDCDALAELTIPASLDSAGASPWPAHLRRLTIPSGVSLIFAGVNGMQLNDLEELYVAGDVEYSYDFPAVPKLRIAEVPELNFVKRRTTANRETLEKLTILADMNTDMQMYTSLSKVTLVDGITSLPEYAFAGCTSLTDITLPDSCQDFGRFAFKDCVNLVSFQVPDGVAGLAYVFQGCSALTDVTIPESVSNLSHAFEDCINLTSVRVPASVTQLEYAFSGCENLSTVELAEGITPQSENVCFGLFRGCTELKTLSWPESMTFVAPYMFQNSGLGTVTLPEGVTKISAFAFSGCKDLTEVNLPESLEQINSGVFSDCVALSEMYLPNGVDLTYADNAFSGDSITLLLSQDARGFSTVKDNPQRLGNPSYRFWDAVSADGPIEVRIEGNTLFVNAPGPGDYVGWLVFVVQDMEGNVIASQSGQDAYLIMDMEDPNQICRVDCAIGYDSSSVFYDAGAKQPRVQDGYNGVMAEAAILTPYSVAVNKDGNLVFSSDSGVAFWLPGGLETVEDEAFDGMAGKGRFVVCHSGLREIGKNAFRNSGISAVYLPESVSTIDNDAFAGCNPVIYCVSDYVAEWAAERYAVIRLK